VRGAGARAGGFQWPAPNACGTLALVALAVMTTAGRKALVRGALVAATFVCAVIVVWREQPRGAASLVLESVYRAAGGFSKGRYPVDKQALQAYLRHQSHRRLAQLSRDKAPSHAAMARQDRSLQRPMPARGRRMAKAMESYLSHQPLTTVKKELRGQSLNGGQVKRIHVRSLQHRSKIQEIALRILGGGVRLV